MKDSCLKTKIVIFGCGYIGTRLAELCLEMGWEVTALTRNSTTADLLSAKGVNSVVANLKDKDWHRLISREQNYLVDCVGAAKPTLEGYESSYRMGMQSILEWLEGASKPVDALLFTSSTSVYPQIDGSLVTEKSGHSGASQRAEILLDAENLCLNAMPDKVSRSYVLRFAGLYGPDRHLLLNKVIKGEMMNGASHRILNLLHRDDAASSIISCLQDQTAQTGTVFNVSDGRHATRGEIVQWLADKMNLQNPGFDEREVTSLPNRKIDNSKIKKSLGWSPKFPGFESGYQDLLASQ